MFKVSFVVGDNMLGQVLAALDGKVAVQVNTIKAAPSWDDEIERNRGRTAKARAASLKSRRKAKRAPLPNQQPHRFKKDQAIDLVRAFGLQPFRAGDLIKRGEAAGLGKPQVYQAIYSEIKAGNLRKLGVGLYQKTATGAVGVNAKAAAN